METVIDVPAQSHPWSTVYTVAGHFRPEEWLLTGGLMVQAHAMIHDLPVRPTSDADFLLDILTFDRIATQMRSYLTTLGYRLQEDSMTGYASRFETGSGNQVDLLVTDYLYGKRKRENARLDGKRLCGMPAGGQAIRRSQRIGIRYDGEKLPITIPDLLGAIMLKSAAWQVDRTVRRDRHLMDAAMLLSLIQDPLAQVERLHSSNDRKRILTLYQALTVDYRSTYWRSLGTRQARQGAAVLSYLAEWAER